MSTATLPPSEHYLNYLRYREKWMRQRQPFTASQQGTPPQYLPYAHYPNTPAEGVVQTTPSQKGLTP